jgi:hypothetical protein
MFIFITLPGKHSFSRHIDLSSQHPTLGIKSKSVFIALIVLLQKGLLKNSKDHLKGRLLLYQKICLTFIYIIK